MAKRAKTVRRDDILSFLHGYLDVASVRDYGPQGLQVEGRREVARVVTGVSCSLELFEYAADTRADMVIVHHGLIWDRDPRQVVGVFRTRLVSLLTRDINLAAYHLPLDAHPVVGHSALIAKALGLKKGEPFGAYQNLYIGASGHFERPRPMKRVVDLIEKLFGQTPIVFAEGPGKVKTVAICSGGGEAHVTEAVRAGIDCYITGEARESTQAYCREAGVNFIAAGHYNTEKLGIIALGKKVNQKFGVPVEFVDIANPI